MNEKGQAPLIISALGETVLLAIVAAIVLMAAAIFFPNLLTGVFFLAFALAAFFLAARLPGRVQQLSVLAGLFALLVGGFFFLGPEGFSIVFPFGPGEKGFETDEWQKTVTGGATAMQFVKKANVALETPVPLEISQAKVITRSPTLGFSLQATRQGHVVFQSNSFRVDEGTSPIQDGTQKIVDIEPVFFACPGEMVGFTASSTQASIAADPGGELLIKATGPETERARQACEKGQLKPTPPDNLPIADAPPLTGDQPPPPLPLAPALLIAGLALLAIAVFALKGSTQTLAAGAGITLLLAAAVSSGLLLSTVGLEPNAQGATGNGGIFVPLAAFGPGTKLTCAWPDSPTTDGCSPRKNSFNVTEKAMLWKKYDLVPGATKVTESVRSSQGWKEEWTYTIENPNWTWYASWWWVNEENPGKASYRLNVNQNAADGSWLGTTVFDFSLDWQGIQPPPACTERDTQTIPCSDGSRAPVLECVAGQWTETGQTCPKPPPPPACTEGDSKTFTCPSGETIATQACQGGKWAITGQVCQTPPPPPPPAGDIVLDPGPIDLVAIGAFIVIALAGLAFFLLIY